MKIALYSFLAVLGFILIATFGMLLGTAVSEFHMPVAGFWNSAVGEGLWADYLSFMTIMLGLGAAIMAAIGIAILVVRRVVAAD